MKLGPPLPKGEREFGVNELGLWLGTFRIYGFSRLKSDLAVRAIAERLVRRSAAAAQSDPGPAFGVDLVSRGVVNVDWSFNQIWTIRFRTNSCIRHFFPPEDSDDESVSAL